jgi:hypothetical protein
VSILLHHMCGLQVHSILYSNIWCLCTTCCVQLLHHLLPFLLIQLQQHDRVKVYLIKSAVIRGSVVIPLSVASSFFLSTSFHCPSFLLSCAYSPFMPLFIYLLYLYIVKWLCRASTGYSFCSYWFYALYRCISEPGFWYPAFCLLLTGYLYGLLSPENGGSTFLQNIIELLPVYMASHPRR